MKNKDKKTERGISFYLVFVFAALLIVAFTLFSYALARYTTSSGGTATATISKYSVSSSLTNSASFNLTVGGSAQTCEVTITNDSDISVNYTVTLTNETGNLPLVLTLSHGADSATNSANYLSVQSVSLDSSTALDTSSNKSATVTISIDFPDGVEYNSLYREIDRVSVTVDFTQASE
ncbi:MAG: hypothetical protein LUD27_07195 [Clostridia bacterium]|nr:hypothetical protein [Clostridia bacterium]